VRALGVAGFDLGAQFGLLFFQPRQCRLVLRGRFRQLRRRGFQLLKLIHHFARFRVVLRSR
jgi:hypothetical protein